MDLSEKEKFGLDKDGDENQPCYHQSGISADCQMGLVHTNSTSMAACQRNQMGASSFPLVPMVESFCPTLWDHQSNAQKSTFPLDGSSSNNVPIIKPIPGPSRLDMAWNPPDRKSKGIGVLPQSSSGMLPHGLSQFPTDLAFIERAARFSCFGGGNFAGMRSPDDSPNPYLNSRGATGFVGTQPQRDESNMGEHSKNPACMIPGSQRSNGSCLMNSQKETVNSQELGEHGETEFSGSWQEEPPSSNGLAARKRKRNAQEMEIDQAKEEPSQQMPETSKDKNGTQLKDEQNNSSLCAIKNNGKQAKDATDPPKEDYIHIRARRGQATNSHSLAERVRREKISERMKFLQDLVPGCSKVTGKAVMLDEIINYVQSLQRQVEFLSMKLATVNPPLDNIEGLLSKDLQMLQSQSATGFSPDFTHPFLNPTSQGLLQSGISGVGPSADVFRRVVNAQLVSMNPFKDVKHQVPNSWDDELHNVLSQMAFGSNLPLSIQDSNDKTCDGFPI